MDDCADVGLIHPHSVRAGGGEHAVVGVEKPLFDGGFLFFVQSGVVELDRDWGGRACEEFGRHLRACARAAEYDCRFGYFWNKYA